MQQHRGSDNDKDNGQRKESGLDSGDIPPITGTAIAVWAFVIGGGFLWFFLHSYISETSEAIKLWVESIFSLALVIVVIIQALIYFRQAKALDKSLEIARESMVYAQRAYVSVTDVSLEGFPGGGVFHLKIENSGNTPAYDAEIFITGEMRDSRPTPETAPQWERFALGLIGPRNPVVKTWPVTSSREQAQLGSHFNPRLYCWGFIRYKTFGKTPRLNFCVQQLFGSVTAGFCPNGNSETWEEDDKEDRQSEGENPN